MVVSQLPAQKVTAKGQRRIGGESAVDRSYESIQEMIMTFALRPGERVNESELSRKLGVSRTPLREALNRLVTEGFLTVTSTKGFFCREIRSREILELYQLRIAIESAGAKLAVQHGSDEDIEAMARFLVSHDHLAGLAGSALVALDEEFHETIVALSGNSEMVRVLRAINKRVRPFRRLDLSPDRLETSVIDHERIVAALQQRDGDTAAEAIFAHVTRRLDEIETATRELFGRIYGDGLRRAG